MRRLVSTFTVALLMSLGLASAGAQDTVATPTPAITSQLDTVTVSGLQPGPGLWRVTSGEHELWILGTISPVPKRMQWDASDVAAVIAESQLVLRPPGVALNADIGFFGQLALIPKLLGLRKNPGKETLAEVLPADVYARWQTLAERYFGSTRSLEKRRPIFVAQKLYQEAIDDSGLRQDNDVMALVSKTAKRAKVEIQSPRVDVKVDNIKAMLTEFGQTSLDDVACLEKTMTYVERDLPVMRTLANAWAIGDIDVLRATLVTDSFDTCIYSLFESPNLAKYGFANIRERIRNSWLEAAANALKTHRSTFATLPMAQLLKSDGLVAALRAQGYVVEAPGEESPQEPLRTNPSPRSDQ